MRQVIRLVVGVLALYVVITASPEQKLAMISGAKAFANATADACTRYAYCSNAVEQVRGFAHATTERMGRISSFDREPALLER